MSSNKNEDSLNEEKIFESLKSDFDKIDEGIAQKFEANGLTLTEDGSTDPEVIYKVSEKELKELLDGYHLGHKKSAWLALSKWKTKYRRTTRSCDSGLYNNRLESSGNNRYQNFIRGGFFSSDDDEDLSEEESSLSDLSEDELVLKKRSKKAAKLLLRQQQQQSSNDNTKKSLLSSLGSKNLNGSAGTSGSGGGHPNHQNAAANSSCSRCAHRGSIATKLEPERTKTVIAFLYVLVVSWLTAFVMVIVHDRVPDMEKYPPLPDILLDNLPHIPWAFEMCELTGMILLVVWTTVCLFHKHRFILMRRFFSISGTIFLLRCFTMLITSLSVPGKHLDCAPRPYGDLKNKLYNAFQIWTGAGMTLQGVRTCGDYMFSGHTVTLTLLNFFITEYTSRRIYFLHTFTWICNVFGVFFILAAHEHYSIDVFIAFYISSRLFLYYHTLANNKGAGKIGQRAWFYFPLFYFFESNIDGKVPNEFACPLTWSMISDFRCYLQTKTIKKQHKD